MNNKKRDDLAYTIWRGNLPTISENGLFTFNMDPKYGKGKFKFSHTDIGIYPVLCEYNLEYKESNLNTFLYKEDAIYLGKIVRG